MLGTILIYGGDIKNRVQKAEELISEISIPLNPNADLFKLENEPDKKSIGIKEVKNAINWLSDKPFSAPNKCLFIPQAEKLTLDAQNSLLKTLEEPPSKSLIILSTKRAEDLIQTVLSRCRKISCEKTENEARETNQPLFASIIGKDLADKLALSQEFSKLERTEVAEILSDWEREIHTNLTKIENSTLINAYNVIREVRMDIEKTNVSLKFALDFLFVQI